MRKWAAVVVLVAVVVAVVLLWPRGGGGEEIGGLPLPPSLSGVLAGRGGLVFRVEGFGNGSVIPSEYTCDGADRSPGIVIVEAPEDAAVYVLVMYDPDAPGGVFYHWLLYDIPGNTTRIPPGLPGEPVTRYGVQGRNSFGEIGYGGPCPPPGHGRHRYVFVLAALDKELGIGPGASPQQLFDAMRGHVVAYSVYYGVYSRG